MAIRPKPTVETEAPPPPAPGPPAPPPAPIGIPDLRTDIPRAIRSPTVLRPVTVGLPPSLYEDYLAYAAAQGHPLAGILRQILTEGLPAALGGAGRGPAPQGLGGVARRTP